MTIEHRAVRPNSLSMPWTKGVETVPTYQDASNDSIAQSYRVTESRDNGAFRVYDGESAHYDVTPLATVPTKRDSRAMSVMKFTDPLSPSTHFGTVSALKRHKFKAKEASFKLSISPNTTTFDMTLFRGGYSQFRIGEVEYIWQARYFPQPPFSVLQPVFKDALLRRYKKDEKSSIEAWYIPQHADTEHELGLGVLMVPTRVQGEEWDVMLISFLGLLLRVIDAKVRAMKEGDFANA